MLGSIHAFVNAILSPFLEVEALSLSAGSVLRFHFDASYQRQAEFLERRGQNRQRRNVENLESFSMNVRVRNDDGFLWRAEDNQGNYTQLQVSYDMGLCSTSLG